MAEHKGPGPLVLRVPADALAQIKVVHIEDQEGGQ